MFENQGPDGRVITSDVMMAWKPGRIYIPIQQFTGVIPIATLQGGAAGTALGFTADAANWNFTKAAATNRASEVATVLAAQGSAGSATRFIQNMTGGICGMLVTTAADAANHFQMLPYDLNYKQPIYFYVWWASAAAAVGARTITWQVLYTPYIPNTTALITPATALSTAIGAQAPLGTANTVQRTTDGQAGTSNLVGVLNPATLTQDTAGIGIQVSMSAFDASFVESKWLVGLEIVYTPDRLRDGHMLLPAKRPVFMLSDMYS